MYTVFEIADFFLSKESMTPKKIQKLVYYAYSWTLALLNDDVNDLRVKLFDNRIEAWVHGPVVPDLYREYRAYGWQDIPKLATYDVDFPEDVLDILNQVWTVYGPLSANQLELISHNEKPWICARSGLPSYVSSDYPIADEEIFKFYNEQANS